MFDGNNNAINNKHDYKYLAIGKNIKDYDYDKRKEKNKNNND